MNTNALSLMYQGFTAFLDFVIERVGGDASIQELQERLTAPTDRLITLNVSYVIERIRRCKAFRYKCKE